MSKQPRPKDGAAPHAVRLIDEQGIDRVGPGGDTLVRFVQQAINFGEHQLFDQLPRALDQIIQRALWRSRDKQFATFGEFALAPPPSGLGIYNDRTLALLKAALDHKGTHVEEWSDVLIEVEKAVHIRRIEHKPAAEPGPNFKTPSKQSTDGALLSLRKERHSATTFKRIKSGKVTITQVAREKGVPPRGALTRYLKPGWRTASEEERRQFIQWLQDEAGLAKYLKRR